MKRWKTQFSVTGRMQFPIDMLRYEGCFPHTSSDAAEISASLCAMGSGRPERIVSLIKYHDTRDVHLEAARWGSFGWVVNGSVSTTKL